MSEDKKPSIFQKVISAGEAALDHYISKARSDIAANEDDAIYRKSIYKDVSLGTGSQGYQEKTSQLSYAFQSQMSKKNSIVAAIIQTLQNKVAAHATISRDKFSKGFKVKLKNEEEALEKIIEELFGEEENESQASREASTATAEGTEFSKAGEDSGQEENPNYEFEEDNPQGPPVKEEADDADTNKDGKISDKEKRRIAKKELQKRTKKKIDSIQKLLMSCGSPDDRPFESLKWTMDSFLRATVRDRLAYDQISTELIPDKSDKLHHWVPVDGATMRFSSPALAKYKDFDSQTAGYDLLYPEKELAALTDQRDAIKLDEEKLKNEDYKYVQVVRGRIVRAFTPDEMAFGMANPTTDIYANGYSVSELEILTTLISAHIFTENYNRSYFTQGFSAKGILHIKSPLNRRKLETIRVQWNHMIKGNRNSFQTPIMSGMEDIKWIPLTQSHSDMEFNNWMNYLIKIICAVYQIDPMEIGFGMKEEGGSGSSLGGDNSKQKLETSKNKGFIPLLKFIQNYINVNIVDKIDNKYEMEFVGIDADSQEATLKRQLEESKYKKSVNEIREEDNLPPIDGCDDLILDNNYLTWFKDFHPDGVKLKKEQADEQAKVMKEQMKAQGGMGMPGANPMAKSNKPKTVKVEYYSSEEE